MNALTQNLKTFARRVGFDVRRLNSGAGTIRTTTGECYAHLNRVGFRPKVVFDVGVASGTFELYENFPESEFLLVEPLKEFEPDLKKILKQYRGSYILSAAAAEAGESAFFRDENRLDGSSIISESEVDERAAEKMTVQTVRLDDVAREKSLEGPFLVKVDVQGTELDVLDGAQEVLKQTEVVSLEVSLFKFGGNIPEICEVTNYMKERGFVAYDIVPGWNRPRDNALGQVDILFAREDGHLRESDSYH